MHDHQTRHSHDSKNVQYVSTQLQTAVVVLFGARFLLRKESLQPALWTLGILVVKTITIDKGAEIKQTEW
jgi:hypothetical protein